MHKEDRAMETYKYSVLSNCNVWIKS